jgi:hypothetical protein
MQAGDIAATILNMAIVYQTFDYADAKYRVHITKNPHEADLWATTVNFLSGHSGDLVWYLTSNRDEATSRIYLCSYGEAQIYLYFVQNWADATWRTGKKSRFRF